MQLFEPASCCRVVPATRWGDAQQHGVGLVPGLIAMLPHAPAIAEGSGIGVTGEVRFKQAMQAGQALKEGYLL